jgi:multidrug resistance protein
MAEHDVEKEYSGHSQSTSQSNNNLPQNQKTTDGLLRPSARIAGTALTLVTSTRSHARSSLSRRRSFVDGHGTFFSDDGDSDEEERREEEQNPEKPFEVGWDGEHDSMNPRNLNTARKWAVVLTLALGSLCVTCTSSLYTTTYDQMDAEFGNSRIVATLGLSLFVFGLGLSPMVLAPLSEFYGRRPIYVWSYIFFTIWLIPCAVGQNIQTMLIARFLDGFAGSAFLSVAGGTVGDMFARHELQAPMMIYTASPFIGPGLGPILGGFINYNVNWRWSYYMLLIWSGVMTVAIAVIVPETYHPVLLRRKAQKKRRETGEERWKAPIEIMDRSIFWTVVRSLYRPFMLLTLEPMCMNLCLLSSILLGILYLFFGAFELVFKNIYNFKLWQIGLSFLGLLIGMLSAIASDPIWHYNYLRLLRKKEAETGERGKSEPEYRLPPSIFGVWLCVIGLFWFAWTIYPSVHWIVPLIGSAFFGCGTILTFTGVFTFLVEAYPLYAASALAANSFARSSFAGAFPLFGVQMYETLGYHWATTLLACLTLAMAPFPYVFFKYGKKLRSKSKFTSKPS